MVEYKVTFTGQIFITAENSTNALKKVLGKTKGKTMPLKDCDVKIKRIKK
jgi:hypothetical protein